MVLKALKKGRKARGDGSGGVCVDFCQRFERHGQEHYLVVGAKL